MMEVEWLAGVYEDAVTAASANDYRRVEELLAHLPRSVLVKELELCLLLAAAQTRLYRHAEAKALLSEAEEYFRRAGDESLLRRWQNGYAVQLIFEGDLSAAKELLYECLNSAEASLQHRVIAYVNNALGILSAHLGNVESALTHFSRSVAAWQMLGDRHRIGFGHYNLAVLLREWGRTTEAAAHYLLAQEYVSDKQSKEERILMRSEQAMILLGLGDALLAERAARKVVVEAERLGNRFLLAATNRVLGSILIARSELDEGRVCLLKAYEELNATSNIVLKAEVKEELAYLEFQVDQVGSANSHLNDAIQFYRQIGSERHLDRLSQRFESIVQQAGGSMQDGS
jgi:tetratricopeptide (TPR) repeat protein